MEASLTRFLYHLREDEEPQGISRCIRCMGLWTYGCEPEEPLRYREIMEDVRAMIQDGRMNRLAEDLLMNRDGTICRRNMCTLRSNR